MSQEHIELFKCLDDGEPSGLLGDGAGALPRRKTQSSRPASAALAASRSVPAVLLAIGDAAIAERPATASASLRSLVRAAPAKGPKPQRVSCAYPLTQIVFKCIQFMYASHTRFCLLPSAVAYILTHRIARHVQFSCDCFDCFALAGQYTYFHTDLQSYHRPFRKGPS